MYLVAKVTLQLFHLRNQAVKKVAETHGPRTILSFCRPGLVNYAVEKFKSCRTPSICPFCWVRQIVNPTFDRVRTALFFDKARKSWRLKNPKYALVVQTHQIKVSGSRLRNQLLAWRKVKFPRVSGAEGSIKLVTVDVDSDNKYTVTIKVMHVVPVAKKVKLSKRKPEFEQSYHRVKNSRELAKLIGTFCTFPLSLLLSESDQTVLVLNARKKLRLFAAYGVLRNDKLVKYAEECSRT